MHSPINIENNQSKNWNFPTRMRNKEHSSDKIFSNYSFPNKLSSEKETLKFPGYGKEDT